MELALPPALIPWLLGMQPKKQYKIDPLEQIRKQVYSLIRKNYRTVEEFCYAEDFQKSTMSRFLNAKSGRTEYRITTLDRLARLFGKKLVIKLK